MAQDCIPTSANQTNVIWGHTPDLEVAGRAGRGFLRLLAERRSLTLQTHQPQQCVKQHVFDKGLPSGAREYDRAPVERLCGSAWIRHVASCHRRGTKNPADVCQILL